MSERKILFCLIAHYQRILVSAGDQSKSKPSISLLASLPPGVVNTKSIPMEHHMLFYDSSEGGLNIVCMADKETPRIHSVCVSFLQDVKKRFLDEYRHLYQQSSVNGLADFSRIIEQRMDFWSNPQSNTIDRVQDKIERTKGIMVDNIEKAIERQENIDVLVERTYELENQSQVFKQTSNQVKNQMWWKNKKMMCILICVVLVIIIILIVVLLAIFGVFSDIH
eukprot:TRINITY_DN7496_c0_g1_i1.p1 TRINITY_DN7496_c0_g1~~TRINITY_DN7496_c0_g1_i1.p1  ORF type:complete len:223 (+),score=27.94 TRINITY_DN7496_c0_g1_i1:34-702(+)